MARRLVRGVLIVALLLALGVLPASAVRRGPRRRTWRRRPWRRWVRRRRPHGRW